MASRVLWVSPVSNLAGVARHILDAARVGIPGWAMEVAAPEGPLLGELRAMGVPAHPLPLDQDPRRAAQELRALMKQVRPQLIHSHLARADFLTVAATRGLPPKLVSTEHGIAADARLYNRNPLVARVKRRLHRARCGRFAALIAVSESTREQMQRAWQPKTPIHVILNGVDPLPDRPPRTPGTRYLSLSRLSHEKNILAILEAFATLNDGTLTIAGDGPDRDAIVARIAELGVGDHVSLPGFVRAEEALDTHDVLVQLSRWENASYSLLDAVVHGLGVVATPVGGNPEILPARCLVEADDTARVAELMRSQARIDDRPTLPDGWPTVAEMTDGIADVYDEVCR